jgi:hypothetical protein
MEVLVLQMGIKAVAVVALVVTLEMEELVVLEG